MSTGTKTELQLPGAWGLASKVAKDLAPSTILSLIAVFMIWKGDAYLTAMRIDVKTQQEESRKFAEKAHMDFIRENERTREQTSRQWEDVKRIAETMRDSQRQLQETLNEVKRLHRADAPKKGGADGCGNFSRSPLGELDPDVSYLLPRVQDRRGDT